MNTVDYDENGLYFLTAKGKGFYDRLVNRGAVALTGINGTDTMSCVAVSIRGRVRESGSALLPRLFEKNPYMSEIYPTAESQTALTVFQIYEGSGEWFDLSQKPIERATFTFGGRNRNTGGVLCDGSMYWLQILLFQMSAEMYRHFGKAGGHPTRTLSALRQLL